MLDLDDIRFSVDRRTYERAVGLYESGKVTRFTDNSQGYEATVIGTHPYHVYVSARRFDQGDCDCYVGQQGELCKHMVALAIYVATGGKPLAEETRTAEFQVQASAERRELDAAEIKAAKAAITAGLRYIRPYDGPSRIWFAYQAKLREGCNRLAAVVSSLPVGVASARRVVDLLIRLDEKLCHSGVDDSDGTVGGFMYDAAALLLDYAKVDPKCVATFAPVADRETCFEWDEKLMEVYHESPID